jgi:hypothetical protein
MKGILYIVLAIIIFAVIINILRNFYLNHMNHKEGMTDASGNVVSESVKTNATTTASANKNQDVVDGIAENAAKYATKLKAAVAKIQTTFSIDKYRSLYEKIIISMDDLINNLMLKKTLTLDVNNPGDAIEKLAKLHQAKAALNSVMKFIDSQ